LTPDKRGTSEILSERCLRVALLYCNATDAKVLRWRLCQANSETIEASVVESCRLHAAEAPEEGKNIDGTWLEHPIKERKDG
jgi:hypothetical protein